MKSKQQNPPNTVNSLSKVLEQSEQIKGVVDECAEELSSVNLALKDSLSIQDQKAEIKNALEKSQEVESKVQEASDQLSAVNKSLEHEVSERECLEHQLAAVKKQEESARHEAFHDPLTGLPNRVLFNERLEHGLVQAKRHGWSLAIMFLDLNDFKIINDVYGHDAGDIVLQTISKRLKDNTRDDDTVSRHGGDEFLYLLMEAQEKQHTILMVEKIIKVIQEPCDIGVRELVINPSIGISLFPKDGDTSDILIKSADKAMYQAKRTKSRYAFASET
ncbi:MAG: diguanylate cyclase [Methylobacter sp.]|nr:diguanylate cyclase [Methylobacter sp.]